MRSSGRPSGWGRSESVAQSAAHDVLGACRRTRAGGGCIGRRNTGEDYRLILRRGSAVNYVGLEGVANLALPYARAIFPAVSAGLGQNLKPSTAGDLIAPLVAG